MTDNQDLSQKTCTVCAGGGPPMTPAEAEAQLSTLHAEWALDDDRKQLSRELKFKGFAKAVYHANIAAYLGDKEGHHPDVQFGWGYCKVIFTSHELGGLSQNDFICAAKFDALVA